MSRVSLVIPDGAASGRCRARSQEYAWPSPCLAYLRWWPAAQRRKPPPCFSSAATTPRFCLAAAAGDSQVNLTWTPSAPARSAPARSAPASNFTFYEGTAPGIGKPVTPGTVTNSSALVTGLTNDTTYYFWLAVGQASNVVSSTAVATPGALLQVRTYKFCLAAVAGDSQVNLTWIPSAPGNNFTIYEGTAPGTGKPVTPGTVTDSGALVTGLTNGTTYYFWLPLAGPRPRCRTPRPPPR